MAQQEIRDVVFNVQVRTEDGKVKIDGLTKGFVKAETAFKRMQTTLVKTNDAIKNTGVSSGLANTAVLEFGRTISDAPYGIQGMGNNITQLVTLMGQLSEQARETGESIGKALRRSLVGPLGIVIAVQVVVAALEIFRQRQQEAKKESESLAEAVAKSAVELKISLGVLNSENVSLENKNKILDELNKKYTDWNLQHSKTGEISETNEAKILSEIGMLENLAKARAMQSVLEDYYAEKAKMLAEKQTETFTFMGMLAKSFRYGGVYGLARGLAAEEDAYDESLNKIDQKIRSVIEGFENEPSFLLDLLGGDKKKKGKISKETEEDIESIVIETLEEFDRKFIALGGDEFVSTLFNSGKYVAKNALVEVGEEAVEGFQQWAKETEASREGGDDDWLLRAIGMTSDQLEEKAGRVKDGINAIADVVGAQLDRDLALEERKTIEVNDQLRQRLRNEELTAEARDKINQEIAKNEADLVDKQNKIEEKRFKLNKAQGIANAVINTAVGVSKVLPNVPLAAFIGALGAAQIATIASQAFVPSPTPTPNLTSQRGGPAESQAPAFNVVGASGQSQLAAAIAGQTSQPVKAYVVSSDVSTAQELDRKIIQGASI